MLTYTALGFVISKNLYVSGWSFTNVALGRDTLVMLTMDFSSRHKFSIIWSKVQAKIRMRCFVRRHVRSSSQAPTNTLSQATY